MQTGVVRTSIDLDPDTANELAHAQSVTREKQATVIRLAIRAGLPLVLNRFAAPRPPGYFADAYARPEPERERLAAAMAKVPQKPERR